MTSMARDIVAFWRDAGPAAWFARNDAFDVALRVRFLDEHFAAARRERETLLDDANGALALILLLDQVPRNVFRNSAHAFARRSSTRPFSCAISLTDGHGMGFLVELMCESPIAHLRAGPGR